MAMFFVKRGSWVTVIDLCFAYAGPREPTILTVFKITFFLLASFMLKSVQLIDNRYQYLAMFY